MFENPLFGAVPDLNIHVLFQGEVDMEEDIFVELDPKEEPEVVAPH